MEAIRHRKTKTSGHLHSVADDLEVALEYSVGLHPMLVSFDDIDILRFDGADRFFMKDENDIISIGSILVGSHAGLW